MYRNTMLFTCAMGIRFQNQNISVKNKDGM